MASTEKQKRLTLTRPDCIPSLRFAGNRRTNAQVAELQTRWLQVPVAARPWKFESSLGTISRMDSKKARYPTPDCRAGTETTAIELYHGDLPDGLNLGSSVAIDTETMGLNPNRDRLCLAQLSSGDGNAHLVKFGPGEFDAPNLCRLLADPMSRSCSTSAASTLR